MNADQTARDRIAAVATPFFMNFSDEQAARVNAGELATAVLAALAAAPAAVSAPVQPPTRADALTEAERSMLNFALDLAQDRIFYSGPEFTAEDQAAVNSLRRMAGEERQDGPAS